MKKRIRVVQFGLGAMGSKMAEFVLKKEELELVAVVVRDESKIGKDLGEVLNLGKKLGVKCYTADYIFKNIEADVMLHAAVSYVPQVWAQIKPAVEAGLNVITIAEEMGYPFVKYPKISEEMDKIAKKQNVTILGSGINPGFAMDYLVLALSGILHEVKKVEVMRLVDFSPFGPSIQKNIGIGLSPLEFRKGMKEKTMPGHIGLPESIYMLADSLGFKIDKVTETKDPVVAKKQIVAPGYKTVKPGQVCGFNQMAYGSYKGQVKIVLGELGRVEKNLDYKNTIKLYGYPNLTESMTVPSGEITTTSHAVNLIPIVFNASPGLTCMKNLPVAPCLKNK